MIDRTALGRLETRFPGRIGVVDLARLTTWRIGGPAAVLEAESAAVLSEALGICSELGLPTFLLGRGSNLLVSDEGFDGLVIRLASSFRSASWTREGDGWRLEAGAACMLPGLAGAACMRGAAGLEFAVGIPGTLGGAVFMNAGAYGGSVSDCLTEVRFMEGGLTRSMDRGHCGFGYRTSSFQESGNPVLSAVLHLREGSRQDLVRAASAILQKRRESFPLDLPNAGSVFRRTDGALPPGRLIEDSGLKGRRAGGAMVSTVHANFIVNTGGAAASDVLDLIRDVKRIVFESTGVSLAEEVRMIGRFDAPDGGR